MQRQRADLAVIRRVHVDHVDVGAKFSSSPPSLPIPITHERGVALDAVVIAVARRAVARAQLGVVQRDRGVEARVGEPRELAADLGVEAELELAHAEPHQLVAAHPPQRGRSLADSRAAPRG